jgi:hypothetical protein
LQAYFLEVADYDAYQRDPDAALWTPVTLPIRTPVTDGVLAEWDTLTVIDGVYMLRLRAALRGGGARFALAGPIRVANDDPQAGQFAIIGGAQEPPPTEAPLKGKDS